ncbi:helix-turn-helix domain-containing protein [Phytoactinopolyspora limicola]|uniref:helix-turn-helix domain-containing protein n=1 Tax=Phytoactinopolyspora limicola TaxID=2715536 RepID=UPI00140735A4|nr:helix-turn-helix domain-containing protein [Phytoactinopolyspora limicola]
MNTPERPEKIVGLDVKGRPARRVDTTARDARTVELRAKGMPIRAIADEVDASVGTVHRVLEAVK